MISNEDVEWEDVRDIEHERRMSKIVGECPNCGSTRFLIEDMRTKSTIVRFEGGKTIWGDSLWSDDVVEVYCQNCHEHLEDYDVRDKVLSEYVKFEGGR